MSSKNDNSTVGAGIGLVVAGLAIVAVFLFALLVFAAFVLTALCIVAWSKPLTIGTWTLEPQAARSFVRRGLLGLWMLPAFALFCSVTFGIVIDWNFLPHFMCGGYVAGSIGWELLTSNSGKVEQADTAAPQLPPPAEPPSTAPVTQEAKPFRYASWDDEEELRK